MTLATLPDTERVVKTDGAVEVDKPIPCQAGTRVGADQVRRCETPAEWRVFVACPNGHDSTQTFCDRHVGAASTGQMQCRRCSPTLSVVAVILAEPIR